jgi:hypothetical protein
LGIPGLHEDHYFQTAIGRFLIHNKLIFLTVETAGINNKKKIILIGIGTLAISVAGYFGWQWWKKRKTEKETQDAPDPSYETTSPPKESFVIASNKSTSQHIDDFPLKKGSRGERVKTLQDIIIAKYGKSVLPKYGADGDFGSEMVNALKKLNLPEVIDENTYNVLVKGNSINAKEVALSLFKAAASGNFKQVLFTLKGMKSQEDYTAVSEVFKNLRIAGVRKTLVNGLLDAFKDDNQKQQIRLEFTRMGLNYDGNKWSLSGLDGLTLITTEPAIVWENPNTGYKVPANMVLGKEITSREGFSVFENGSKRFLVQRKSVRPI